MLTVELSKVGYYDYIFFCVVVFFFLEFPFLFLLAVSFKYSSTLLKAPSPLLERPVSQSQASSFLDGLVAVCICHVAGSTAFSCHRPPGLDFLLAESPGFLLRFSTSFSQKCISCNLGSMSGKAVFLSAFVWKCLYSYRSLDSNLEKDFVVEYNYPSRL